ncbi:DsbA family protein [Methanoregula sp.]|uniref:DsbA family protein n=1 Tax=Methanoregula sp. TaxID=2052170 RepID=UPI003C746049
MTEDTGKSPSGAMTPFFGKTAIAVIVVFFAVLVIAFAVWFSPSSAGQQVSSQACGYKVLHYVNQNLVQQGSQASLDHVTDVNGIYEIAIQYDSQPVSLYATRDCNLLFTNYYDMNASTGAGSQAAARQPTVKSDRPVVNLYVMAFCPYGTQAEAAMKPVVDLLESKVDIRLRYITTVSGTTAASVSSLHGAAEAQEDLRQVCMQKYYPGKYWDYVGQFDSTCYPVSTSPDTQTACQLNASASAGIEMSTIQNCISGPEGVSLLKADEADSDKNGVSGSPTLIINGVTYSGDRTPEAYKEAICNSFTNESAECATNLTDTVAVGPAGGCG